MWSAIMWSAILWCQFFPTKRARAILVGRGSKWSCHNAHGSSDFIPSWFWVENKKIRRRRRGRGRGWRIRRGRGWRRGGRGRRGRGGRRSMEHDEVFFPAAHVHYEMWKWIEKISKHTHKERKPQKTTQNAWNLCLWTTSLPMTKQ